MSTITIVTDVDEGYEWMYIDNELKCSGEPIDSSTWVEIINRFTLDYAETFELSQKYMERVNYNFQKMPRNLSEFMEGDLE